MTAPTASQSPDSATLPPADTAPGTYSVRSYWLDSDPSLPKCPLPEYVDDLAEARRVACRLTRWQRKRADVVRVADGKLMGWSDCGSWVWAHGMEFGHGDAA